ncbi:hypothetical protein F4810DRAFT_723593 [Camillea tinctor]|nr:hypothetical protein F4810DRAFT_723593 [Camillea tinctor]
MVRRRRVDQITIQIRLWASQWPRPLSIDEQFASYLNHNLGDLAALWSFAPESYLGSPEAHPDIFPVQVNATLRYRPELGWQLPQHIEDLKACVQTQMVPSFSERYQIEPLFLSFVPINAPHIRASGSFVGIKAPAELESEIKRGESTITEAIVDACTNSSTVIWIISKLYGLIRGTERKPPPIDSFDQGMNQASQHIQRLKRASNASERMLRRWSARDSDDNHALLPKSEDSLELIQHTMDFVQARRALEATMNQVMPLWDKKYSHNKAWSFGILGAGIGIWAVCTAVTIAAAPFSIISTASLATQVATSGYALWKSSNNVSKVAMGESLREAQKCSNVAGNQLRNILFMHFLYQEGLIENLGDDEKRIIMKQLQIQPDLLGSTEYIEASVKTALEEYVKFNQEYIAAVEKLIASQ